MALDLRGLSPAPVTPFTEDGAVDFAAIQRLGSWLGSIEGVKSLVVLGHAGEGTFLTEEEQLDVIRAFVASTDGRVPDRKSTRLNSSHANISYAVFCLKKKNSTTVCMV